MKRIYMLDTNICSYIIKENPQTVVDKFWEHTDDDICISVITFSELLYGAQRKNSAVLRSKINSLTNRIRIVELPEATAKEYANIRILLEKQGTPIGNMDMLIASHALAVGAVVVTNNEKHFSLVPNLVVENWC